MKQVVTGILAHVDSGKTTLSEALLYNTGEIRKLGRVDHKNAYLDTDKIERERGITIFSKQAQLNINDTQITLLDTPGHVDFSAEAERTLRVLDFAVLVVSGTDGVQSHTETIWRLLKDYNLPVFIFVNKMDLGGADRDSIMENLHHKLSDGCLDFSNGFSDEFCEAAAMCDENALNEFLENGTISQATVKQAVAERKIFPCFFGSALRLDGIDEFIKGLADFSPDPVYGAEFGAKVFKISEDERGMRLTHMKITGGSLLARDTVSDDEKANEIRIYSGDKYQSVKEATAGTVCAVTGLTTTYPGQGLGSEQNSGPLTLQPVFTYGVKLPPGTDAHTALTRLKRLEQEETQLHIIWNERLGEIQMQMMGEIQLEVLRRIISERFVIDAEFEKGGIVYKETITNKVEGVGHYEPLRHYAEVHLLLEPGKEGSGIVFSSRCSEDELDRNWQRLILTHLEEKTHLGVLTGSPITDIKITLVSGRAHQKHTEGGDFRQATYRAVRQGLMQAESVLLEPWYDFVLEIPTSSVGRAMTDIERMGGKFSGPEQSGDSSVIKGSAPVVKMCDYHKELTSYTHGVGRLSLSVCGYKPCLDQSEVIKAFNYNPESDTENPCGSVFCSHGAGFNVPWNEVYEHMHLPAESLKEDEPITPAPRQERRYNTFVNDEELIRIFELTYGKIQRRTDTPARQEKNIVPERIKRAKPKSGKSYLLVDGYNIIFAWRDLKELANDDLSHARTILTNRLCAYRAMRNDEVILVFDAYKVKGNRGSIEKENNITVVYTKEAETADAYIEKASNELGKSHNVRVATSDYMEQLIILGNGAFRITADELLAEVVQAENEIREIIEKEI